MTQRRLDDLAEILRAAGLRVVEVPGWRDNSRPESTGGFDPVGNLWHHTGAKDTNPNSIADDKAYAEWLAEIGRSDLPAPLCQVSIGRDGTVYVCAAGRGNHAGTAKASGPVPGGDGNELYIGWECQNTGSEGWSPEQYGAMVTAAAATSKAYGWAAAANRAHKETSKTGKWDPGALDMDRFRADVARAMETEGIDLDMTPDQFKELVQDAVRGVTVPMKRGNANKPVRLPIALRELEETQDLILAKLDAIEAKIGGDK